MIKASQIDRNTLLEELNKGFCKVQFRKVTNGQYRTLVCTLDKTKIPARYTKSIAGALSGSDDPDLLPVFDLVSKQWKSFYISNVLYMYTEEELTAKNEKKTKEREKKQEIIGSKQPKVEKPKKKE